MFLSQKIANRRSTKALRDSAAVHESQPTPATLVDDGDNGDDGDVDDDGDDGDEGGDDGDDGKAGQTGSSGSYTAHHRVEPAAAKKKAKHDHQR